MYNAEVDSEKFRPNEIPSLLKEYRLSGRVLYLARDPDILQRQLAGEDFTDIPEDEMIEEISTDAITNTKICLEYTGHENGLLGKHLLTGLKGGIIPPDSIKNGKFEAIVAGPSFGRGSSRYHAVLALKEAGINFVIAKSERIFDENAVNAGLYILPPEGKTTQKLLTDKVIDLETYRNSLSPISKDIMSVGGLINYLRFLEQGEFSYPKPTQTPRPMTMIEKIIARKTYTSNGNIGVAYVKPSDEVVAQPDKYYGYELQTTMVRTILEQEFGEDVPVRQPDKAVLFNDHTALVQTTTSSQIQQREQRLFANHYGIINFENDENGAPAICHTKMLEDYALPGELLLGNDSHTDTLGAVNALAIGKGSADLAGALAFDKMVIKVPETIRINLHGGLKNGATMKDFMLKLGSDMKKTNEGSGKVFEFGGDALDTIPFDEQIKLTNMAIELQAFTGIVEPNTQMFMYLQKHRGLTYEEFTQLMVGSDANAVYAKKPMEINLENIETMVATPGDTQNGVPLSEIEKLNIKVHKAYIGSCTHGTVEDLRQAAEVLKGRKVSPNVKLYIQASSWRNRVEAVELGYIKTCVDAGAEFLTTGCGACMNAGPGSTEEGEVGVFATNRNFAGRTGSGETYLANVPVTAASAVAGVICGPDSLKPRPKNIIPPKFPLGEGFAYN